MDCFTLIKEIISFFNSQLRYIRELEDNLNTLKASMDDLKEKTNDIRREVETQDSNQMNRTHQWLGRAEAIEDNVEGTLREGYAEIENRCLGVFCPWNWYARYKLQRRVIQIIDEVAKVKGEGKDLPVVPSMGMDSTFKKTWSCITEEKVGIIGIYGMAGVGKTTLLKRINDKLLRQGKHNFDVVIFVAVSEEVHMLRIQEDVANKLDLSFPLDGKSKDRASKLYSELSKKKFVLLLDDIWKWVDLTAIGIPSPNIDNKSKVLFTTRSEFVCRQMEAQQMIRVGCLDWPEAWKLFQEMVGEEALNSHPEIPQIAQEVAEECAGLPLALVTVGRALTTKRTRSAWHHAVTTLRKSASEFLGMGNEVFPILRFTYLSLPNDTIKSCFLYCSLFPKNHSIKIDQLIRYWIGEGFLDPFDDMDHARNRGNHIVRILKEACLLENGQYSPTEEVRMSGIFRDLALWIGCDCGRKRYKFLVQAGVNLLQAPEVVKWREAERVSLMNNSIQTLGDEVPNCPNLLTLIISANKYLTNISDGFFKYMKVLKVLDISNTKIHMLPPSIFELVELQYLGLAGTAVRELPQEMKFLVKLKCLDLSYTRCLKFIPFGILSKFSMLQMLDLTKSNFVDWEAENCGGHGTNIEELECSKDLMFLSINISNSASLNKLLSSGKFECSMQLAVNQCDDLTSFPLPTPNNKRNLREVHIFSCNRLEDLSSIQGAPNLELLELYQCENLKVIFDGDDECFPNLRRVTISHLYELRVFSGAPKLELLDIDHCKRVKFDVVSDGCFPNLRQVAIAYCDAVRDLSWLRGATNLQSLDVSHCEYLEVICDWATDGCFPNLRGVDIHDCNELKDLTWLRGAPNLESLDVINCKALEQIFDGEDGKGKANAVTFSRLQSLTLINLPKLKSIPWLSFPSDIIDTVEDCPRAPLKLSTR